MSSDFPREFILVYRARVRESTKALSTENRNELLLEKCIKIDSLTKKYSAGHRGYALCLIRDEVKYVNLIRGIENSFIENQISRLTFEVNLIDREAAYLNDPRGFKNALEAVKAILTLIIEELNPELQPIDGD